MSQEEQPPEVQYSTRLDDALALVARSFRKKDRKQAGHPYLFHLLQVSVTVAEHDGDEEQMIAALLHDYLEDIPGAQNDDLAEHYGPRVARLVRALSDATDASNKEDWRPRKEKYLAHLRPAREEVKLISAADKLHNSRSIRRDLEDPEVGSAVWGRFKPSADETLWYYREVLAALRVVAEGERRAKMTHRLIEELSEEVRQMHELSNVAYSD